MTDIHTHLLPHMDDGSRSAEESRKLLAELKKQGVSTVVATPHFYPDRESPESFLKRRERAFSALAESADVADIRLGAEVLYYAGVSRTEELEQLTVQGTDLLLLEMPFCEWPSSVLKDVLEIRRERGLNVVLAHIDRYFSRHNDEYIGEMLYEGVLLQANADAFSDWKKRRRLLKMLERLEICFLGSDCHGMEYRPPKISSACSIIEKKLGTSPIEWLERNSALFFGR